MFALSHGNATVESGFSVNKDILVDNLKEWTIIAQWLVYDSIRRSYGTLNVPITREMGNQCSKSHAAYTLQLEETRKEDKSNEDIQKEKKAVAQEMKERESRKRHLEEELLNETRTIASLKHKFKKQVMIPPSFSDLGKAAKDLFSKGFDIGLVKLEHKGKTSAGLELTTSGTQNIAKGDASASVEGKYKVARHGLSFKEKWDTSNVVKFDIEIEDKLIDGLKQTFSASFEPHTGKKSAAIKSDFKAKYLSANLDMNFVPKLTGINCSLVMALPQPDGFLAGANASFDTEAQAMKYLDLAVGVKQNDVTFFGKYINRNDVEASIYQRHSDRLETGLQMNWTKATQATRFGGVVKYMLEDKSYFKMKVDNTSLIGLCYSFPASSSVNVTLSGDIDGKNFDNGGHRLGLSLEFSS